MGGSFQTSVDLGSYEGYHSLQLARFDGVQKVVGLEARQSNVDRANFVKKAFGANTVEFHVYDLEFISSVPLPVEHSFDLVYCAGLLYHVSRPWELIKWMSALSQKYLFLDTHYAELPLWRCGPYLGDLYGEMGTETCGTVEQAFWTVLGDLQMMLLDCQFLPRFMYRYSAGHFFQPRVWIFAEKAGPGMTSSEFNGVNPLRPDAVTVLPELSIGPQPAPYHRVGPSAALVRDLTGSQTAFEAMKTDRGIAQEIMERQLAEINELKESGGKEINQLEEPRGKRWFGF